LYFTSKLEANIQITFKIEVKMKKEFRSSCPIASTLDILGDKWSLVIVRDMLIRGKKTYKEFSLSEEGIATGILASRLKQLEKFGFITKRKLPENKKENIYLLTEKGIDLAPMVIEITLWADKYMKAHHPKVNSYKKIIKDKDSAIHTIQNQYREVVAAVVSQS